jgi:hypothetical protein
MPQVLQKVREPHPYPESLLPNGVILWGIHIFDFLMKKPSQEGMAIEMQNPQSEGNVDTLVI